MADNPGSYRNSIQFGHADSVFDGFQPKYSTNIQQYSGSTMYPPMQIMEDHGTGLSQDTIIKIQELKRLAYRYPHYCAIPDGAIKLAIYYSINRDNTLLDQMLELLRSVDAMNKY
jgi:hypothetical protein